MTKPPSAGRPIDKSTAKAQEIAAMPDGRKRQREIERFHADHYSDYERLATRFRTSAGVSRNELEDLTQVIAMVADKIIRDPKPFTAGIAFASTLKRFSSSTLRDWSFSSENTGIAGGSGGRRREMTVARVSQELENTLKRKPTVAEIVEAAQADIMSRRSNPTKGGKITERDVHGMRMLPTDFDAELAGGFGGAVLPGDGLLDPMELQPFALRVITTCYSEHDDLGRLAEMYLEPFMCELASVDRTVKELAAEIGRTTDWVRRSIHDITAVAREVLKDDFGITGA